MDDTRTETSSSSGETQTPYTTPKKPLSGREDPCGANSLSYPCPSGVFLLGVTTDALSQGVPGSPLKTTLSECSLYLTPLLYSKYLTGLTLPIDICTSKVFYVAPTCVSFMGKFFNPRTER